MKPRFTHIPAANLNPDPEGRGLLDAAEMQVYDRVLMAAMADRKAEFSAAVRDLRALPLESRYLWRIISALGFVFGDFDSACVRIDLQTLPDKETDRLCQLTRERGIQFLIWLREMLGQTGAQELLAQFMDSEASKAG